MSDISIPRLCTFYWSFEFPTCKYKHPAVSSGAEPPVPNGCVILSSSHKITLPDLPRSEPSPIPCYYALFKDFKEFTTRTINDPDGCFECDGFIGYPPGWPPRLGESRRDPRYGKIGDENETWHATGEEKEIFEKFRYAVTWTRTLRCRNSSGQLGAPRTQKTTIFYSANWIVVRGVTKISGSTSLDCKGSSSIGPLTPAPPSASYYEEDTVNFQ
jgi:hypothetical protein